MDLPNIPLRELAAIFAATLGMVLLAVGDLLAVLALFDVEVIDEP
jgi:hypothetical protein